MRKLIFAGVAACLLAACQGMPSSGGAGPARVDLSFSCTVSPAVPAASYVGPYAGIENVIPAADAARDVHCADAFKALSLIHI